MIEKRGETRYSFGFVCLRWNPIPVPPLPGVLSLGAALVRGLNVTETPEAPFENQEEPEATAMPTTEESAAVQEQPGTTIPTNTYEMVVVASREARRLNDRLRRLSDDRPDKVTSKAMERVLAGQVRFAYDDSQNG